MATRKGINISGNYAAPHKLYHMPFSYMYFVLFLVERSDKVVFYILLKLDDHPTRCFNFGLGRIHPNGCMFELNFKKFTSKTKPF